MAYKVFFPLDGSERTFQAMEKGLTLLKGMSMDVTLYVVMQKGFEHVADDRVQEFDDDEEDEIFPNIESCERMLDEAEARCKKVGVKKVKRLIHKGSVPKSIIDESVNHDLMVMHDMAERGFMEKLRMSNTEKLLRKSIINVLIIEDDWDVKGR